MKVLHLATYDNFGGAARAAYRQHLALQDQGAESCMLVRYKYTNDSTVQVYSANGQFLNRVSRLTRRLWINRQEKLSRKRGGANRGGLTDPRADLLRNLKGEIANFDIINIHKVEHFVDLPSLLSSIPGSKPVVITLHDLSPITGGCDYTGQCQSFARACGCCPLINSAEEHDYSRQIFQLKAAAYATRVPRNFALVANSHWTASQAQKSGLTAAQRVEVIHYGLNQKIYTPENRLEARQALGISSQEAVLCFAAHDLSYERKGGQKLSEALVALETDRPIRVLTMGSGHIQIPSSFRHVHYGHLESDHLLSLLYRASDVFVIPSLEEAFGQTALEAVACGTVVAGFEVGGIVDIVQNGINGHLASPGNAKSLSQAISQLLRNHTLREEWKANCQSWVSERFSFSQNAQAYINLYSSLL